MCQSPRAVPLARPLLPWSLCTRPLTRPLHTVRLESLSPSLGRPGAAAARAGATSACVLLAMGWSSRGRGAYSAAGASSAGGAGGGKEEGHGSGGKGKGKGTGKGKGSGNGGGQKPTDDPDFVRWSVGMSLEGSEKGVSYVVDAYVASGTFSRVFRVREVPIAGGEAVVRGLRWGKDRAPAPSTGPVFAAKVMRKSDSYIQYSSDALKEGEVLQTLEKAQAERNRPVLTMRCIDSFATKDAAGGEYWCLILEWLDASLFDVVRANGNRGLHLSMVRVMLEQLLEQLRVLQEYECTHTDIKHKNCCLVDTSHFMAQEGSERPTLILTNPLAKFIDYGNAVFEGDKKTHPIHTKQFRAPEVLLNITDGWGPPSDTWTVGITVAYLVSGQLLFNSHDPVELACRMVDALGPFPPRLLAAARDHRVQRAAHEASAKARGSGRLGEALGLRGSEATPEGQCLDLLRRLLALDPRERVDASEALRHPFIRQALPPVPARAPGVEVRVQLGKR